MYIQMISNSFFIQDKEKEDESSILLKHLLKYDTNTKMRLEVNELIKKYEYRFSFFCKEMDLNITELTDSLNVKYKKFKNTDNYIMIYERVIKPEKTLYEYLYNDNNLLHKRVYMIFHMFKYLSESLQIMREESIVVLDLSPFLIKMYHNDLPIIHALQYSFVYTKLTPERINIIFNKKYNINIFLPVEYHIILFILENKRDHIDVSDLEKICEDVTGKYGLSSLNIFTKDYLKRYKESSFFSHQHLLQKSKYDIINILLNKSNTWNNYQICIMFLLFLRDLFLSKNPDLLKTDNIITKMYNIFIQNINPDPIKRNDERNNILKISNILDEMNLTQIQELCKLHV
jgi:hypothetical protein